METYHPIFDRDLRVSSSASLQRGLALRHAWLGVGSVALCGLWKWEVLSIQKTRNRVSSREGSAGLASWLISETRYHFPAVPPGHYIFGGLCH
jgi:hypothetical protein